MAEKDPETKWCKNCKRDIAEANFVVHEVHCQRNIVLCEVCEEPVPKSEVEEHFQEYHAPVPCPLCQAELSPDQLHTHQDNDCPKRLLQCVYCELEMPQCDLQNHLDYCGTRTEICPRCQQYIMHKDRLAHEDTDCTRTVPIPTPTVSRAVSDWTRPDNRPSRTGHDPVNSFAMDEFSRILNEPALKAPLGFGRKSSGSGPKLNNTRGAPNTRAGRQVSTHNDIHGSSRRRPANAHRETIPKQSNRDLETHGPAGHHPYGNNLDQDQLLAMQLELDQQEAELPLSDLGRDQLVHPETGGDTILPCEFCDVLFSSDDLIQHQSACLSQHISSSPPLEPEEDRNLFTLPNNSPGRDSSFLNRRAQPQILDNLAYLAAQDRLASGDPDDQHINPGLDDDLMLPCEFCDVLMPEYFLIQHQAVCDNSSSNLPSLSPTSPVSPGGPNRTYVRKTGPNRGTKNQARSKPDVNVRRRTDAPTSHRNNVSISASGSARFTNHWESTGGSGPGFHQPHPVLNPEGGQRQHSTQARSARGGSSITGVSRRAQKPRGGHWDAPTHPDPPSYPGNRDRYERIHEHAQGVRANVDRRRGNREYGDQRVGTQGRQIHQSSSLRNRGDIGMDSQTDNRAAGGNYRPRPKPRIVAPMRAEPDFSEAGYNMRLPPRHVEIGRNQNGRGGPPTRYKQNRNRRQPQGDV